MTPRESRRRSPVAATDRPRVLVQLLNMREIATSGLVFTRGLVPRLVEALGPGNVVLLADAVAQRHLPALGCEWDVLDVPDIRLAKNVALRRHLRGAVLRHRADVVYVPEGPLIGAPIAAPVVSSLHSHLNFSSPQGMWWPRRLYWEAWANRAYRRDAGRSAALLAPTRAFAEEYERFVPQAAGRLHVVPHGVSPAFGPGRRRSETRPAILFVGNDMGYKNLAGALRAFARIAPEVPHELRVAGVSRAALARIAEGAGPGPVGVLGRVRALGLLDEGTLVEEYCGADALLFPSLVESFGLPVLEAMASGLPVVCSDLPSLREVTAGAAVLAPADDAIAMAAALRGLLRSPESAARLRERGLARARELSWDRTASEVARIIGDVARAPVMAS